VSSKKHWVLLAAAAAVAVLAAGWFLLVSPTKGKVAGLREDAQTQQGQNRVIRNTLALLRAQERDLPGQEAELAKVQQKIPDNPALPALIRSLSDAADDSGVSLVSLQPATPAPAGATGLSAIPVTINVRGGYFPTNQFVSDLEALPRALLVTNLAVLTDDDAGAATAGADDARPGDVTTTIQATVFMGEVSTAAAPPAGTAPSSAAPTGAPAS
jgi:type IV pilus assembly protein PilO